MLARSPEPEAHDKVLDNNPDRIGIWKCWFLRRGENRRTRRKTSRSRVENQQQTQPTYDAGSGNRTRDTLVGGERSHHCANPAPPAMFNEPCNCLVFLGSRGIYFKILSLTSWEVAPITLSWALILYFVPCEAWCTLSLKSLTFAFCMKR